MPASTTILSVAGQAGVQIHGVQIKPYRLDVLPATPGLARCKSTGYKLNPTHRITFHSDEGCHSPGGATVTQ